MGKLEVSGKKRAKKRNLKKAILESVQAAALIGVAIAAPNVPSMLKQFGIMDLGPNQGGTIGRARKQLVRSGHLKRNSQGLLRLSPKGQDYLLRMTLSETFAAKKRRWDDRWRILIFDVPEYRKGIRNQIRRTLISRGFLRLQDSVWIYPYDCEDYIVLLKADMKIGKDVLYMIVDELEGDGWIREHFNLPKKF